MHVCDIVNKENMFWVTYLHVKRWGVVNGVGPRFRYSVFEVFVTSYVHFKKMIFSQDVPPIYPGAN